VKVRGDVRLEVFIQEDKSDKFHFGSVEERETREQIHAEGRETRQGTLSPSPPHTHVGSIGRIRLSPLGVGKGKIIL